MTNVPKLHPQLTVSQKLTWWEKFRALMDDINNACVAYMCEVLAISKKHGRYVSYFAHTTSYFAHAISYFARSEQWVHHQLFLGRNTSKQSHHPNAWNVFVHQQLNDINESMSILLLGSVGGNSTAGIRVMPSTRQTRFKLDAVDTQARR